MQRAESRDNNEMNGRVAIRTEKRLLRYAVWLKSCTLVTAKGGINCRPTKYMSTGEGNTRSKCFADEGVPPAQVSSAETRWRSSSNIWAALHSVSAASAGQY